jgi:hypothetical protein
MIEFKILGVLDRPGQLAVHETEYETHEARLAKRFAEIIVSSSDYAKHLGDALHDGPKANLISPEIISKRACDLACYLMIEMRKREWIVQGPSVDEVYKKNE